MTTFLGGFFFQTLLTIVGISVFKYIFVRLIHVPGLTPLVGAV